MTRSTPATFVTTSPKSFSAAPKENEEREPFEPEGYDGALDVPSYYGNDLEYFGYDQR
ncbi:hypothetical protein [Pseudomonas sp. FYR_7]|uniref:hypothetical protein n=1 Tax=Pseudomonas sp. FYR_7 TaxID=3367174 RepID=UPI00370CF2DA